MAVFVAMLVLMLVTMIGFMAVAVIMVMAGLGQARLVSALFIALPSGAIVLFHDGQARYRYDPCRRGGAARAFRRQFAFAHPPQLGKRTAFITVKFVERHIHYS